MSQGRVLITGRSGLTGRDVAVAFQAEGWRIGHNSAVTVTPDCVGANEVKTQIGDASRLNLLLEGCKRHDPGQTLEWILH